MFLNLVILRDICGNSYKYIWRQKFQRDSCKPFYDRDGAWLATVRSTFPLIGLKNRKSTQANISNFKRSTNADLVKPNLHKGIISVERSILPAQV